MTEGIQHEFERHKTIPWSLHEFCMWRGVKLICHLEGGVTTVHFPGGAKRRISELPGAVPPLKVRPRLMAA